MDRSQKITIELFLQFAEKLKSFKGKFKAVNQILATEKASKGISEVVPLIMSYIGGEAKVIPSKAKAESYWRHILQEALDLTFKWGGEKFKNLFFHILEGGDPNDIDYDALHDFAKHLAENVVETAMRYMEAP